MNAQLAGALGASLARHLAAALVATRRPGELPAAITRLDEDNFARLVEGLRLRRGLSAEGVR